MSPADRRLLRGLAVALFLIAAAPVAGIVAEGVAFGLHRPGVVALLESGGRPMCHHRPERTLQLAGRPMTMCARCTGLYLAWPLGLTAVALGPLAARRRLPTALGVVLGASAVGFVAASLEQVDWLRTANPTRLGLGFLLGIGPPAAIGLVTRALWHETAP